MIKEHLKSFHGGRMEKRYRALRLVGTLYKILGAIVLVLAIIGAIGVCLAGILGGQALSEFSRDFGVNGRNLGVYSGALGGIISGVITLIGGGIGGLTLFATGEAIFLLMDIEENTRAARLSVKQPETLVS
jgi:hypothetical protein